MNPLVAVEVIGIGTMGYVLVFIREQVEVLVASRQKVVETATIGIVEVVPVCPLAVQVVTNQLGVVDMIITGTMILVHAFIILELMTVLNQLVVAERVGIGIHTAVLVNLTITILVRATIILLRLTTLIPHLIDWLMKVKK
jgi:hypothetical protein